MYLYQTIVKELADYPLDYFVSPLRIGCVSLMLTKRCTNQCGHCCNYSSPQAAEQIDLPLAEKIIEQAASLKHYNIQIWGGEPFLHKNLFEVLACCLRHKLGVRLNTNAFWVSSPQVARDFINKLKPLLAAAGVDLVFFISCDKFHQQQPATPLENVVNFILALEEESAAGATPVSYNIVSVKAREDTTIDELFSVLRKKIPDRISSIIKKINFVPIENSVGRAKTISSAEINYAPQGNALADLSQDITIYISAAGNIVFSENWIGDNIFPLGNIKEMSLPEAEKILSGQRLFKLLQLHPAKYFFYPFRKYVDVLEITNSIASGQLKNTMIIRDRIAGLMQITEKQFDKSAELSQARQIYVEQPDLQTARKNLHSIDLYGDLADRFYLKNLLRQTTDAVLRQDIQALLDTTYSY
ncbi:MAG: radical SAM protein [Candidatus Margulisbacteria bacterium]|jgi:pyruvate-formate lyase-activating enzyme|nr:radical SAM protein [Candidatus Margulisiibacteriota bacterium]